MKEIYRLKFLASEERWRLSNFARLSIQLKMLGEEQQQEENQVKVESKM